MELSDEAREARNKYQRDWQKSNPDYNKNRLRKRREERPELQKIYFASWQKKKARELDNKGNEVSVKENEVTVKKLKTTEPGQRVCIFCGEFFQPVRITGKYCSDNCRVKFNYRKTKLA